jgi:hypothetical protein
MLLGVGGGFFVCHVLGSEVARLVGVYSGVVEFEVIVVGIGP